MTTVTFEHVIKGEVVGTLVLRVHRLPQLEVVKVNLNGTQCGKKCDNRNFGVTNLVKKAKPLVWNK